jgi:hypothetical protein
MSGSIHVTPDRRRPEIFLILMIRLTETQEIAPYPWVHPDEER